MYSISKKDDIEEAKRNYRNNPSQNINLNTLTGPSLWDFFSTVDVDRLYSTTIKKSVSEIKKMKLFQDINLMSIINSNKNLGSGNKNILKFFDGTKAEIKRNLPALVRLDDSKNVFSEDPYSHLIVSSSDSKVYGSLFKRHHLSNDGTADLPSFQDSILLFQEYGYMGEGHSEFDLLNDLNYSQSLKNDLKKVFNQNKEDALKLKCPYLNYDQIKTYLS